jgi:hypothetical protein
MSEHLDILIKQIKQKKVVLFLGSGFAFNALHPDSKKPPLGAELGKLISDRFLGGNYKDSSLAYISDLAINTSNLYEVQNFIYDVFEKFRPNENHLKYCCLPWKAIFTTNYDSILERAYLENNKKNAQDLSVVVRNTSEEHIFRTPNSVPYFKLHGCITVINDIDLPLILSSEQYITHRNNRERLFQKLEDLARDFSIVFIGYSNQDPNIRGILNSLEVLKDARPRSYMVGPNFTDLEVSYWENRRITPLKIGHEEFITYVSDNVTKNDIMLSTFIRTTERKIEEKFTIRFEDKSPSESLLNFLDFESEYIHSGLTLGDTIPKEFYKGVIKNWDPIIRGLDVRRKFEDSVLTDLVLEDKFLDDKESYLFLIKGFAGSGKTVMLKRLAWETSIQFNKCCLYIKADDVLRSAPVIELFSYVKERIYLFIDNLLDHGDQVMDLIKKAERDSIPISIISTERSNQLNGDIEIEKYITKDYQLNYLTNSEVDLLIDLLEKHDSLGHLKNKSKQERKRELAEQTGRVLLVALYEATGGLPFEEIIFNEYESLKNDELKGIYLTVSVFHRLNTKVRAGLISRIHGVSFEEFKTRLFKPLEYIVFDEKDYKINDFVYTTRHPYIAQMIFELVLKDQQERYDEYIRILNNIDIDYRSDWHAFLDIVNARNLNEIFNDPNRITNIYDLANELNPDDPKLLQQRGIFHMISTSGNLYLSNKYLKEAQGLDPNDIRISHSLAELALKRGENSKIEVEKKQFLEESKKLCEAIIKKSKSHAFAYHTLLKVDLYNFKEALSNNIETQIEKNIKSFEKNLFQAKQLFPNETFILDTEAKFKEVLDEKPDALEILKKAYEINKASPFIAIRYSKLLSKVGKTIEAISNLKKTLELNPSDKNVSYYIAKFISEVDPHNHSDITHYYRRAFTKGDTNYDAQFWYARSLYLKGEFELAKNTFESLSKSRVSPKAKNRALGIIVDENKRPIQYSGVVKALESNFGFVKVDKLGQEIFMFRDTEIKDWIDYRINSKLNFNIAFSYKGPTIVNPLLM